MLVLVALCVLIAARATGRRSDQTPDQMRVYAGTLLDNGRIMDLMEYLNDIEKKYGNLHIDDKIPSLYNYKALALASSTARQQKPAIEAILEGLSKVPHDTRAWINVGELKSQLFDLKGSLEAYEQAINLGDVQALPRYLKIKGWSNSWDNFEVIGSHVYQQCMQCVSGNGVCNTDSSTGLEYANVPGYISRYFHAASPNARLSANRIPVERLAPLWHNKHHPSRLKLGIISSDFGVHPVSTLIRGFIEMLNDTKIDLYCFALNSDMSWWGKNISGIVKNFYVFQNINSYDAAMAIADYGVEILIDLNGHTVNSGLPIMSHQPAPIQFSFLGLPTTTGASFIDYYIGDTVANPAETTDHFTEKLMLLPPSYIVNDYAQLRGGILGNIGNNRAPRSSLQTDLDVSSASILFATFSNSQKVDPTIFHTWMNILLSYPQSKLMFVDHKGADYGVPNMREYSKHFGVNYDRLVISPHIPWIYHLYTKTSVDLHLDTYIKSGHTTGLDALWSGIPSVGFGGGEHTQARAAESIAYGFNSEVGITFSFKEYEDTVQRMVRPKKAYNTLRFWRRFVEYQRKSAPLFNTKQWTDSFTSVLLATWESAHITVEDVDTHRGAPTWKLYHIFTTEMPLKNKKFPVSQVNPNLSDTKNNVEIIGTACSPTDSTCISSKVKINELPNEILSNKIIFLNIGGYCRESGWYTVNIANYSCPTSGKQEVDIIREMNHLDGFANESVSAIYASHILEHNSYGDGKLEATLSEWHRVLRPGGLLFVAVPNIKVIAKMLLDSNMTLTDHWHVTRMMYGGQSDEYDYHMVGFDELTLPYFLKNAGFCEFERVESFNLFPDTSELVYKKYRISLNMVVQVCHDKPYSSTQYDGFGISHSGTPYKSDKIE